MNAAALCLAKLECEAIRWDDGVTNCNDLKWAAQDERGNRSSLWYWEWQRGPLEMSLMAHVFLTADLVETL